MFLTKGDLNHSALWREWIRMDLYNVYVHPKQDLSSSWLGEFVIEERCETSWEHLIHAQRALLRAAVANPENVQFVLLSDACVPLRTAEKVYSILTSADVSRMCHTTPWFHNHRTIEEFPREHRRVNHQWFILNRKHAELMAADEQYIEIAAQYPIDCEGYPASFLSLMNVLDEVVNVKTTFVDWSRGRKSSPYIFRKANHLDYGMLLQAKRDGEQCILFARKMASEFPDSLIRRLQANVD